MRETRLYGSEGGEAKAFPTPIPAEQQMRKPVLTRKVSQQNRSAQGANTQAILMTLLRSAELQGTNPVENLLAIAKNALTVKTPSGLDYKIAS